MNRVGVSQGPTSQIYRMGDCMQDIKGTLVNLTRSVTKTSGDLLKTTKLTMSLSTEETNLKNLYMEIGKKVHEIYQYGGSLGKFFDEKYLEIDAAERKIADLKEQIGVIKGTRVCTKCGKTVDRSAEFCQKCGVRVELNHAPEAEQAPMPPMPEEMAATAPPPVDQERDIAAPQSPAHGIFPKETPPLAAPALRTCRVCSSQNEAGTKFCISCGRILD